MKKKDLGAPMREITFHCGPCCASFKAEPGRVEDDASAPHHPWRYFAACPKCGADCEQAQFERALLKAWASATGPRTPEGKAATAKNLEGHPTPEEALRTRFNGMKHGMSAKTATYFPAKPDGYAFCATCEVDRVYCAAQTACVKQTQNFMLHHAAFQARDPKVLNGIYADLQAALFTVLQQILQTIVADGVKLVAPQWYTTKDGNMCLAEYTDANGERKTINDVSAHPLFKPLAEMISRLGLSLADMGMTVKVIEHDESEFGQLDDDADKESAEAYRQRQTAALEKLVPLIERARAQTDNDPILVEYRQEAGDGGGP